VILKISFIILISNTKLILGLRLSGSQLYSGTAGRDLILTEILLIFVSYKARWYPAGFGVALFDRAGTA
jgi:hypothetical protein